jgi:Tfp pilus assembly protein PilE
LRIIKEESGLTLIEILVSVVLAFTVLGIVSGVLMQSFKNMEITDTSANLRQEAHILIATFNSQHLSPIVATDTSSRSYTVTYTINRNNEWELLFGNQVITSKDYDIKLVLEQTGKDLFDTSSGPQSTLTVDKKLPLKIKYLILKSKKNNQEFKISTTLSRL